MKSLFVFICLVCVPALAMAEGPSDPFFYAQQTSLWAVIKVAKRVLNEQLGQNLEQMGYDLVSFEDPSVGYLIIKPMVFTAEFGHQTKAAPGTSASTEVEVTALVQPKGAQNPISTLHEFIRGTASQSSVGQLRLDVLCDNEIAVAAGRAKYHEHKFTASFEYDYTTPVTKTNPFKMSIKAYVFKKTAVPESLMFNLNVNLTDLQSVSTQFGSNSAPELFYSTNPPEPAAGTHPARVSGTRVYTGPLVAYEVSSSNKGFSLALGQARGGEPLVPVPFPPFDNGGAAIPGSENWPAEVVQRLGMVAGGEPVSYLLFQPPPVEIENGPFSVP